MIRKAMHTTEKPRGQNEIMEYSLGMLLLFYRRTCSRFAKTFSSHLLLQGARKLLLLCIPEQFLHRIKYDLEKCHAVLRLPNFWQFRLQVFVWQVPTIYYPFLFLCFIICRAHPTPKFYLLFHCHLSLRKVLFLPQIFPPSSRSSTSSLSSYTFCLVYSPSFYSPLPVSHYPSRCRPHHSFSPLPSCSFSTSSFSISLTRHHLSLLLCQSINATPSSSFLFLYPFFYNWGNFSYVLK